MNELILQALNTREKEILALIEKGLTDKEIALKLSIRDVTIKTNLRNIFRKLRVKNRTEAILLTRS
jgi:DNA-binding NarL/FixJ family response regulator